MDWVPPLTEQWAATYMEVLAGVLVFALGVAALILQLALPAYLHTLATRKGLWRRYAQMLVAALAATTSFIWLLHPTADAPLVGMEAFIGHSLLTATLALMIIVTIRYVRQVDSTKLVKSLIEECDKDLQINGMFDDTLDNLIDIGIQAKPGFEKEQVIRALEDLVDMTLEKYLNIYDGTLLKPMLFGLEEMLVQGSQPGSRQNFRSAAHVLKATMDALNRLPEDMRDGSDMADLISVTTSMTSTVLEIMGNDNRLPSTYFDILEAAPPGTSALEMYRVGVYALVTSDANSRSYELSVRALSYLIPADGAVTGGEKRGAELLGLMAHMWFHNEGTRRLITNLMMMLDGRYALDRDHAIDTAIEFHFATTNFETVDMLIRARDEWAAVAA